MRKISACKHLKIEQFEEKKKDEREREKEAQRDRQRERERESILINQFQIFLYCSQCQWCQLLLCQPLGP